MFTHLKRLPGWWSTSLIALGVVAWIAPQQLGVLTFKLLQITIAVGLAYLADKALFRDTLNVDEVPHDIFGAARLLSRALVALAIILGFCVGL
jgi:hypothetical protein